LHPISIIATHLVSIVDTTKGSKFNKDFYIFQKSSSDLSMYCYSIVQK
jgi:hypothetical protein